MSDDNTKILTYESKSEKNKRLELYNLLKECPIPQEQVLSNLGKSVKASNWKGCLYDSIIV